MRFRLRGHSTSLRVSRRPDKMRHPTSQSMQQPVIGAAPRWRRDLAKKLRPSRKLGL